MCTTCASGYASGTARSEVRDLGRLLDGTHRADEPGAAGDGEDPAQPSRGLVRWQRRELGNGGLDRRDLAEVDEAGQRADRAREERRAGARRADDEHEPVVERPEALPQRRTAPRGEALRDAEVERDRLDEAGHGAILAVSERPAPVASSELRSISRRTARRGAFEPVP